MTTLTVSFYERRVPVLSIQPSAFPRRFIVQTDGGRYAVSASRLKCSECTHHDCVHLPQETPMRDQSSEAV